MTLSSEVTSTLLDGLLMSLATRVQLETADHAVKESFKPKSPELPSQGLAFLMPLAIWSSRGDMAANTMLGKTAARFSL